MKSLLLLVALLVLFERDFAQVVISPGSFTQLGPKQTVLSGSLGEGQVLFYNFNGFTPGACWTISEDATFDLLYGSFADNGTLLTTGDFSVSGSASDSGNIKLGVTGWADFSFNGGHTRSGTFDLNMTVGERINDGNNQFSQSVQLPSGQRSYVSELLPIPSGLPSTCSVGDVDFVTFTLPVGACWSTSIQRNFDEIFGLYAPNGTLIRTDDNSLSGVVDSTGKVTIAISGWNDNRFVGSHSHSGSYNLTINTQTPGEQTDNTFATRRILAPGVTTAAGDMWALTGSCALGDVDFYEFTLAPGVCAQTAITRNFDEVFGLFAPNGTKLQHQDSQITTKVDSTGKLVIAISGWPDTNFVGAHSLSGTYNFTINTFQSSSDGNNIFANATVVDGAVTRSYVSTLEPNTSPCTSNNGDVDFVTFTNLPAGQCFYTLMNRAFDEILGWYDANGTLIVFQDTQVVGKVPGDGKVTIAVSGWADSTFIGSHSHSGNYNLTLVTVAPTASDGDDSLATRTVLAAGVTSYSSNLAATAAAPCNNVGDIDYLEFQVSPGSCFSTNTTSAFDAMLGWVDETNGTIYTVQDSGVVTGITPANGKLVLAVTGYRDTSLRGEHSQSGNYTVSVQTSTASSDASESPSQPTFSPTTTVSGDLYPSTPGCGTGDKDFFLFLLPAGSCFFTNQTVSFDEWMGAFYSNGTSIGGGDSSVSGFVPQDGVLIVGITGYPDFSFTGAHQRSGTYRITVNTETVPFDGDNTFQTARVINNGSPVSGSISSYTRCQGASDVDFITFTNLTPGACFQTTVVSNFTSGQYLLGRFNSTGGLVDYTSSQFTDIVPSNGVLTFAVSGSGDTSFVGSHTSKGSYTLSLNITVNPIVEDGNDVFANATVLAVNVTSYNGNLFAVQDITPCTQDNRNSDVDFIKFQIASSCYYRAVLTSTFDGYLGLYNSSGQRVDGQDSGIIENQADSTGIVTFAVTAWPDTTFIGSHTSAGNYTLTLTLDCGNAPNGFRRVRGGGVSTSGNLQSGFVDRWTFENQTAGACFVTNTDPSFDAVVGWYSDAGVLNEYNDFSVTAIIPQSGQVNIAISGWPDTNFTGAHTRSGPYTLALAITQNTPPPPSDGNDNFNQRVTVNGTSVSGSIWATIDVTPCPNDHNTVNDVDYFEFVGLPAGYCAATRMNETFDSALALLSSNGTILDWQDYTVYTIVPSNGRVILAVTGYPDRNLTGAHQKNGNYTLSLDLTRNQPAPASDNNNNFFTPTVVNVNTFTVSGSIWSLSDQTPCPNDFTPAGDVDYYRFGPYTPGYCFQTQINSTFDEYLGWFSNQGLLLDEEDYQVTGIVPADGFLYIAVSGYRDSQFNGNHQQNGNYTLSIKLTHNTPPPASDNNNRFNVSQKLAVGQTSVSGSIWATIDQTPCPNDHNTVNDVDFYTFQGLEPGSCFQIDEDATFDAVTGQYNKSGGLVQWADYTLYGNVPSDGIVYLAISGWADTTFEGKHLQNGNYTLKLKLSKNDAPGERNDNVFANRRILNSAVRKASGDIWYIRDRTPCPNDQPPSDVDFFSFTGLPAGTCFRTSTDTNFDTIIGWYNSDGVQRTWSDSEIYGIVPQNGVVNIALSAWADWFFVGAHTNGGRYTVTLELDDDCGGAGGSAAGQAEWCAYGCLGKQCGLDGCGLNSCGSCSPGEFCTQAAVCSTNCTSVCTEDQQCGLDGCGGYCGFCSGPQDVCSGGQCVCVPDCTGRVCGDDGCGGSCGVCSGAQEQCFDGVCRCVANCTGFECGNDGCGGICGVCGPYYTCGTQNQCVRDPLTQPSCDDYFGLPHQEVNLVLLEQVNEMLRDKILETIDNLEAMKDALLAYDPDAQLLDLANLIDQIHLFCSGPYRNDTCLSLAEFEFIETAFLNAIHHVTIDPLSECAGRVCGTTSYGGSCGSCPTGQTCSEDGQCVCVYDCSGRVCGTARQDNGTSLSLCPPKSCGTCQDRYECTSYQCTPIPHVPVTLRILDCDTNRPVKVDGVITISHGAGPLSQYQAAPETNITWNPELQEGTWDFGISAIGYVADSQTVAVEWETTGIDFCLHRATVSVTVRDEADASSVQNACQISIAVGSLTWSQTTPPNPWVLTIPDYGYGQYTFGVNCLGYDEERFSVQIDSATASVHLDVNRTPIVLSVVDCDSLQLLAVNHSIEISSTFSSYTAKYSFTNSTTALWVPPTIGTYDFSGAADGYVSAGESRQIEWNTTSLNFCLTRQSFLVGVREQGASYVTSTCRVTSTSPVNQIGTITPPNPFQVTVPDNGLGTWNFEASCDGFITAQGSFLIDSTTALVELVVSRPVVEIEVRQQNGNQLIGVNAAIQISGTAYNFTFNYVAGSSNKWTAPSLGDFTFMTNAEGYAMNTEMRTITASTTSITLYVFGCGDGVCSEGETFDFCPQDCAAIVLQFETYDTNSPVTGYTVSTYENNPRTFGGANGPVANNEPVVMMKTLSNSSNVLSLSSFNRDQIVYIRVSKTGFIDFYWTADMSKYDPTLGQFFTLRGHLSSTFTSADLPYRVINTWRTTDNEPAPYAPTDLNLHLFFADGTACDYVTVNATQQGALACRSISDTKQSGGPASIEFSLAANSNVTIWNSKPPRNPALAPSQANRYLVNSGSYVVLYGITADAATGKQLSQVLLEDALRVTQGSNAFDLWRIADVSVAQPQQGDITVTARNFLGSATVDEDDDMFFDCQINPECDTYMVPFVDVGRK